MKEEQIFPLQGYKEQNQTDKNYNMYFGSRRQIFLTIRDRMDSLRTISCLVTKGQHKLDMCLLSRRKHSP